MNDYWDTFAYSLPRNHFHLLIKTKSTEETLKAGLKDFGLINKTTFRRLFLHLSLSYNLDTPFELQLRSYKNLVNLPPKIEQQLPPESSPKAFHDKLAEWVLSERFRRFMLSYAKAINIQENRNGSLLQTRFRRKEVHGQQNCKNVVIYLHRNAIHHRLCAELGDFPWDSYNSLLSNSQTSLNRKTVFQWFDGKESFLKCHLDNVKNWRSQQLYIIEE